jgi:uncharacterized membrane protein YeaQ/YmgE (transglycosylase-associated protein family)
LGVGLAAGWLAAKFVKGHGLGLVGDIVVGVAGSYLGYELLPRAGVRLGAEQKQASLGMEVRDVPRPAALPILGHATGHLFSKVVEPASARQR